MQTGRSQFKKFKGIIQLAVKIASIFPLSLRLRIFYGLQNSSGKKGIVLRYIFMKSCCKHCGDNVMIAKGCFLFNIENLYKVDNPVSLYAATKKSDELMAHAYSKLYKIPATGLRFFTVYGPMGRPDMAYFGFTNKLVKGEKIQIFNFGDMKRDFTYVDDIVTGIVNVMQKPPAENEDGALYKVYNIGNNKPENLLYFVETLEKCLMREGIIDKPAEKELLPMQPGDVYQTYADVDDLMRDFNFKPNTSLEEGLAKFAKWYKEFYGEKR